MSCKITKIVALVMSIRSQTTWREEGITGAQTQDRVVWRRLV